MPGRPQAFVHTAEVVVEGDDRAVGAAVTVELCGHWEHPPPCRVPHRTDVTSGAGAVAVRVLFACDPALEGEVRGGIERARENSWDARFAGLEGAMWRAL